MGARLLWTVLGLVLLTGCNSTSQGKPVAAPASCRYRTARIEVQTTRGSLGASDMGPRWFGGGVSATLLLQAPPGTQKLLLDSAASSDGDRVKVFRAAKLEFAPDGHALVLSLDKGASWSYVALDTDEPFYCAHASFSGQDPWARAPTTRTLVLEILASSTEPGVTSGRNHASRSDQAPYGLPEAVLPEFSAAVSWAGAHLDDAQARLALAKALLLPGEQLGDARVDDKALASVVIAAREHADVREFLQSAALDDPGRLLDALGRIADAPAQDRLAQIVSTGEQDAPTEVGDTRLHEALHALVAATLSRKSGSEAVSRVLVQAAETQRPLPPGLPYDYEKEKAISGRYTERRLAVYGLAALGTPVAMAALEEIAKEPCRAAIAREGKDVEDPPDASPDRMPSYTGKLEPLYDELQRDDISHFSAACWAKAALAATATTHDPAK